MIAKSHRIPRLAFPATSFSDFAFGVNKRNDFMRFPVWTGYREILNLENMVIIRFLPTET
jgi:hypothetical protein